MRPIGKANIIIIVVYSSSVPNIKLTLLQGLLGCRRMTLISDRHGHLNEVVISETGHAVPHCIPLLELCYVCVWKMGNQQLQLKCSLGRLPPKAMLIFFTITSEGRDPSW